MQKTISRCGTSNKKRWCLPAIGEKSCSGEKEVRIQAVSGVRDRLFRFGGKGERVAGWSARRRLIAVFHAEGYSDRRQQEDPAPEYSNSLHNGCLYHEPDVQNCFPEAGFSPCSCRSTDFLYSRNMPRVPEGGKSKLTRRLLQAVHNVSLFQKVSWVSRSI